MEQNETTAEGTRWYIAITHPSLGRKGEREFVGTERDARMTANGDAKKAGAGWLSHVTRWGAW